MASVTIQSPVAPAAAPNAPVVQTTPTITGGVMVTEAPVTTAAAPAEPTVESLGFKTPAELAKSYQELRAKMSGKVETPAAPAAPVTPPAAATIEASGLDFNAIAEEFTKANGTLTAETTAALTAKGLTVETVKTYVAGQEALGRQVRAEYAQIAGSEQALDAVRSWAPNNLPKEEVEAYTAAIERGDAVVAKMLFQNMVNKYQAVNGKDPKIVTGSVVPGSSGVEPFASWEHYLASTDNKKYATDETYRAMIAKRLAASNF